MTAYLKYITCLPVLLLLASCSASNDNDNADSASVNTHTSSNNPTETLRIAAAANLAGVLPSIIETYHTSQSEENTDASRDQPKIEVTYASSGKLYAQINAGAPYDIFLSADQDYPAQYVKQHTDNSQHIAKPFTYARGQLALYSSKHPLKEGQDTTIGLDKSHLEPLFMMESARPPASFKVVIANPNLAPYGASAKEFLLQQGLYQTLSTNKNIIQAENISQAFQYTHTASTDYGFVALSQLISANVPQNQYIRLAPESYPPILQDGIVISDQPKAVAFSHYLQSKSAQQLFSAAGYLPITD